MKSIVYWGKVLPERAAVSMKRFQASITSADPHSKLAASLTIDIIVSQVIATVEGESLDINMELLKNSIQAVVRERLDAFGYITGRGYDVEITGARDTEGNVVIFGVEVSDLAKRESERQITFEEVSAALVVHQPYLRYVLADLREAIREPIDTAFLCFRAIETIKQFFCNLDTSTLEDKEGWRLLRESLRVDKDFINHKIKDAADPRRHGQIHCVSTEERMPQLMATRAIVTRFCIYLNRGCKPLPAADYPILKDSP